MDDEEKRETPEKPSKKKDNDHSIGMILGMCLGMAIGSGIGFLKDDVAIWMSIGLCMGLCIGMLFDQSRNKKDPPSDGKK